jgi:hypothetical protein
LLISGGVVAASRKARRRAPHEAPGKFFQLDEKVGAPL